jgi:hypothetical protein
MAEDRYKQVHELLGTMKKCAIRAGIYEHMFLAFGSILGAIRPTIRYHHKPQPYWARGQIEHDSDADMGFLKDRCEPQQLENYYNYCCSEGLMSSWHNMNDRQQRRRNDGSLLWFSVRRGKRQVKCCNWMFFEHNGYSFHSKGRKWLVARHLPSVDLNTKKKSEALAKGVPAKYVQELVDIEFEGLKMHVPKMSGTLLDLWYPSWHKPKKGGASAEEAVLVVGEWADPGTWKILRS